MMEFSSTGLNPRVQIFRHPLLETAVANLKNASQNVKSRNDKKREDSELGFERGNSLLLAKTMVGTGRCFVCSLQLKSNARKLKETQMAYFKKRVFTSDFIKEVCLARSQVNNFEDLCSCCAVTVAELWTLNQKLQAIQKKENDVVQSIRTAIKLRLKINRSRKNSDSDEVFSDDDEFDITGCMQDIEANDALQVEAYLKAYTLQKLDVVVKAETGIDVADEFESIENHDFPLPNVSPSSINLNSTVSTNKDEDDGVSTLTESKCLKYSPSNSRIFEKRCKIRAEKFSHDLSTEEDEEKEELMQELDGDCVESNSSVDESVEKRRKHGKLGTSEKFSEEFKCDICEKTFKQKGRLDRHKQSHENGNAMKKNPEHICGTCNKGYYSQRTLRTHMAYAHDTNGVKHECSICLKTFWNRPTLDRHKKMLHQPKNKDLQTSKHKTAYLCSICGWVFNLERDLKRHTERSHDKIKNHECTLCHRRFYLLHTLKKHEKTHLPKQERPEVPKEQCDICGKNIVKFGMLRHKEQVHDKIRRHSCITCGASFFSPLLLKRHNKIHAANKPYCNTCKRVFTFQSSYEEHVSKKLCFSRSSKATKNRCFRPSLPCFMCIEAFKSITARDNHLRKVHLLCQEDILALESQKNDKDTNPNETNSQEDRGQSNESPCLMEVALEVVLPQL